jgi:hypothetical protein
LKSLCAIPLLLLVLCGATLALAQSTNATISGVVVDPAGKVIPGAAIEIVNDATGVHYSSATNGSGIYTVTILPPGQYRVQISKVGFKTLIKPGIVLNVQSAVALNFTLPLGATSESVTVEAGASAINTVDGSVSTVIDRDFVENIPLNGRSFQDLLTLSPGVLQVANSAGSGNGVGYSGDIVVNGQRTESNYYTVDGVSANTGMMPNPFGEGAGVSGSVPGLTALGTTQSLTSIDSLQEFRSTTSTYSAEYGRSPGGQFSFSTRSGTNGWHGSLYDFFRNDALNANNWFNDYYQKPKGQERQNDFGGTFGGPVVLPGIYNGAGKTFFFLSYEGLRLTSPQAATPVKVPGAGLRQQATAALQPLLNAFPVADGGDDSSNDGFAYYIADTSFPSRLNNTSLRFDHTLGDKLTLFGRYADTLSDTTTYKLAVAQRASMPTQTLTLGSTYAVTSSQSNEFRMNFTKSDAQSSNLSTSLGGATPLNLNSLPGPNNGTFPQTNSELYATFTFASFTSFTLSSLPANQFQFNLVDTHSWTVGKHSLKAGVDWRRLQTSLPSWNPVEEIAFAKESEVLNNSPSFAVVQSWGTSHDQPVYQNFSGFVQDEWKATSHLALSLGLRWDVNPAPTNSGGPSPYTVDQITDLKTTDLAPQGTPLWNTDWLGLAPRVGAAYQLHPGSPRSTVIRGGFGIFYDPGNTTGSLGFQGIGFVSNQLVSPASFPLSSAELTVPPPSVAKPYGGSNSSTSVIGFDPNLKLPYAMQYNLAIERALSGRDTLTIGYVGSGARKLLTTFDAYPGKIGNANFGSNTILALIQGRASSGYNSFQAKYQRTLSNGLQALVSYTWSHSIDNASSNFNIYYLLRASSDFDIRQNLQAALTYVTPNAPRLGRMGFALKNWGFDFRLQAHTALPVDIIGTQELDPNTGKYIQYQPNRVAGQPLYLYDKTYPGRKVINYGAFQVAANGVQGDLPRNDARGFSELQLDTAFRRDFPLGERFHLQFRAEAFNVSNHPMFGPVYNYLFYGPSLFGHAYSTLNSQGNLNSLYQSGGPRSLQLSLKMSF